MTLFVLFQETGSDDLNKAGSGTDLALIDFSVLNLH